MICDSCGKPIKDIGWRCYPARVDGYQLAGTTGQGEGAAPIGAGVNVCAACLKKVAHPLAEETE